MKKFLSLLLASTLVLSSVPVVALANNVTIKVEGQVLADAKAILKDGTTLLPVRSVSNALGGEVTWDAATKTATVVKNGSTVVVPINEKHIVTETGNISISTPAQIIDGRTYVPLRALGEALNCGITWVGETKTVEITQSGDNLKDAEDIEEVTQPAKPKTISEKLQGVWSVDSMANRELIIDGNKFVEIVTNDAELGNIISDWENIQYDVGTFELVNNKMIISYDRYIIDKNSNIIKFEKDKVTSMNIVDITDISMNVGYPWSYTKKESKDFYKKYSSIVKNYDPDDYYIGVGAGIKTLTAVTKAKCKASYIDKYNFDKDADYYLPGCERYTYRLDKKYAISEAYDKYFAPYIEYLSSMDLKCIEKPVRSVGGFFEEDWAFQTKNGKMYLDWIIYNYTGGCGIQITFYD